MSKKISQLTEATDVLDTDILPIVNDGETKKVTKANFLKDVQSAGITEGEVPAGLVDGSNTVFTLSYEYQTGTTRVYLNGLRMRLDGDYTETGDTEITFVEPPLEGDTITIDYIKN